MAPQVRAISAQEEEEEDLSPSEKRAPIGLKWRSHTVFILGTVGMGIFTDFLLYAMLVPVLPFMLRDRLHLPPEEIQSKIDYLLATYAGGSVLFSPIAGLLADRVRSRQLPFLAGILALFLATLLFAATDTLWVLYLARLLQGVSAATVWSVGMALVVETVGAQNMGKAMGTIFSFITPGTIFSPTIGGAVYSHAGYLAVFAVAGAVLLVDFVLRMLMIEKRMARQYEKKAVAVEDHDGDDGIPQSDAEPSENSPLLSKQQKMRLYKIPADQPKYIAKFPLLYCLQDPSLIAALLLALVQAIVLGSFDATIAKFAEETFRFNSLQAGLLYIALGMPDGICSPLVGWLIDKYGTRPISLVGLVSVVPCLIALRAITDNSHQHLALYCILLGLNGAGLAFLGTPSLVESGAVVQNYYDANEALFNHRPQYAIVYGILNMLFTLGLAMGPLIAGALKEDIGYGNMNAVLAGIVAVMCVVSALFLGRPPKAKGQSADGAESDDESEQ